MTIISGVGSENTSPAATTFIEGETAGGTGEHFQISNLHKNMTAASTTVASVVELAIASEVNTGTDATRAITPDALAGSNLGTARMGATIVVATDAVTTGDGKFYFPPIPASMNGMNLISVVITVFAKSTSGTPTWQIARGRQANATTAHAFTDVFSTRPTIDANEFSTLNAATPYVIDTSNDDIATGDIFRVDCDVAGTGTTGCFLAMEFQLP